MPIVKIDRDTVLDKIYELRGTIDPENRDAAKKIVELVELISKSPDAENEYPRIRIR